MALAPVGDQASSPNEDAGADEAWLQYRDGKALTTGEAKHHFLS